MNRRELLKKCLLSLSVLPLAGVISLSQVHASSVIKAIEGKLGYKNISKFPQKKCENCKSFNKDSGECVLVAMKKAMKAEQVIVEAQGYCNMWSKIS